MTAGPTRSRRDAIVTLPRAYLLVSLLLLAQFVLGMAVNLFVTIPAHHPGAHPSNYFAGSPQSIGWAIHAVGCGWPLTSASAWLWSWGHRDDHPRSPLGNRVAISTSVLGGAAILGAAFDGASFLDFNQDCSSMIMAGLFAVAVGSYVVGLATHSMRRTRTATSDIASQRP